MTGGTSTTVDVEGHVSHGQYHFGLGSNSTVSFGADVSHSSATLAGANTQINVSGDSISLHLGASTNDTIGFGAAGGGEGVSGTHATVYGGSGAFTFFGAGSQGDTVIAGAGGGFAYGGYGGQGDRFEAGTMAGAGAVTFVNLGGNDTFVGGTGNATMVGGSGHVTFEFDTTAGGGNTLIVGFDATRDKIDLDGYNVKTAIANQVDYAGAGAHVVLNLQDGTSITVYGVNHLGKSNFS